MDGDAFDLDERDYAQVKHVADLLARGVAVEVNPVEEWISTREAAHRLRVSRPTLVKLLDDGLITYEQPGVHRRVSRASLDEFIASRRHRRREGLRAMADTYDDVDH